MKIVLIDIVSYLSKSMMPPLGLLSLISYARKYYAAYQERDFLIYDAILENDVTAQIDEIKKIYPTEHILFGFSMNTHNRFIVAKIAIYIKSVLPKSLIAIGGPHATLDPDVLTYCPDIDIVIKGEAEQTLVELLDKLNTSFAISTLKDLPGITYRDTDNIVTNEPRKRIVDLDSIPFPARDVIDMSKYTFSFPTLDNITITSTSVLGSRGCPYKCVFCSVADQWGRKTTYRSPENVIEEIKELIEQYHCNGIYFFDDTFTLNRKRVEEICNLIMHQRLNIYWFCEVRANTVDKKLLELMYNAGCRSVAIGVESGKQEILDKVIHKGVTLDEVKNTVRWCKELGIYTKCFFSFSYPQETYEDVLQTIAFMKKLQADSMPFAQLRIYPGTPVFDYAKEKKTIPADFNWFTLYPEYSSVENSMNIPLFFDKLSKKDIKKIIAQAPSIKFSFQLKHLTRIKSIKDLFGAFQKVWFKMQNNLFTK